VCRSLKINHPFKESCCCQLLQLEFHSIVDEFVFTVAAWRLSFCNMHTAMLSSQQQKNDEQSIAPAVHQLLLQKRKLRKTLRDHLILTLRPTKALPSENCIFLRAVSPHTISEYKQKWQQWCFRLKNISRLVYVVVTDMEGIKLKQSRYRPGVAKRVPGS